jgi:hypothetical protein
MISDWNETKASDFNMCESFTCEGMNFLEDNPRSAISRLKDFIGSGKTVKHYKNWEELVQEHAEKSSDVTVVFGLGPYKSPGFSVLSNSEAEMRFFIDQLKIEMLQLAQQEETEEDPYISHVFDMVC